MPNKWTEHVHSFAKKHGMTYMCAMTDPACSADYKANKPKKPLTRTQEREHMGLEDFDYKPASSPEKRFRMSVAQRKSGEKKDKRMRVLRAIKEKALEKKVELMEEAHNKEGMDIEDLKSLLLRRSRGEVLPVAVNVGAPAEPAKKRRGRPQKYATPEEARRAKIKNTIEAQKRRKLEGRGSQLVELASSRGYVPVGTSAMSFSRASGGELSGKIPKKNELIMKGSGFTTDIARRLYDWFRPASSFEEWRARQQSRGMSDAKAEELLTQASADARLRDAEQRLAEAKTGSKKQKDAAAAVKERKVAIARERGVFQGDVDNPVDWAEARAAVPPAAIGDWEEIDGKGRKRKRQLKGGVLDAEGQATLTRHLKKYYANNINSPNWRIMFKTFNKNNIAEPTIEQIRDNLPTTTQTIQEYFDMEAADIQARAEAERARTEAATAQAAAQAAAQAQADELDRVPISDDLEPFDEKVTVGYGRPYQDWEHMKWGSFTKQFNNFRTLNPHSRVTDLKDFADVIVAHPDHFHKRTVKRARFYINVLNKKK